MTVWPTLPESLRVLNVNWMGTAVSFSDIPDLHRISKLAKLSELRLPLIECSRADWDVLARLPSLDTIEVHTLELFDVKTSCSRLTCLTATHILGEAGCMSDAAPLLQRFCAVGRDASLKTGLTSVVDGHPTTEYVDVFGELCDDGDYIPCLTSLPSLKALIIDIVDDPSCAISEVFKDLLACEHLENLTVRYRGQSLDSLPSLLTDASNKTSLLRKIKLDILTYIGGSSLVTSDTRALLTSNGFHRLDHLALQVKHEDVEELLQVDLAGWSVVAINNALGIEGSLVVFDRW